MVDTTSSALTAASTGLGIVKDIANLGISLHTAAKHKDSVTGVFGFLYIDSIGHELNYHEKRFRHFSRLVNEEHHFDLIEKHRNEKLMKVHEHKVRKLQKLLGKLGVSGDGNTLFLGLRLGVVVGGGEKVHGKNYYDARPIAIIHDATLFPEQLETAKITAALQNYVECVAKELLYSEFDADYTNTILNTGVAFPFMMQFWSTNEHLPTFPEPIITPASTTLPTADLKPVVLTSNFHPAFAIKFPKNLLIKDEKERKNVAGEPSSKPVLRPHTIEFFPPAKFPVWSLRPSKAELDEEEIEAEERLERLREEEKSHADKIKEDAEKLVKSRKEEEEKIAKKKEKEEKKVQKKKEKAEQEERKRADKAIRHHSLLNFHHKDGEKGKEEKGKEEKGKEEKGKEEKGKEEKGKEAEKVKEPGSGGSSPPAAAAPVAEATKEAPKIQQI